MTTPEDIHHTMMMRPDTSDELAILAKDCTVLKTEDRELIERAAEELRQCYRYMTRLQVDLHEANSHRVASGEKLGEVTRELEVLRQKVALPAIKAKPLPETYPRHVTWYPLLSGTLGVNGPIFGKPLGT